VIVRRFHLLIAVPKTQRVSAENRRSLLQPGRMKQLILAARRSDLVPLIADMSSEDEIRSIWAVRASEVEEAFASRFAKMMLGRAKARSQQSRSKSRWAKIKEHDGSPQTILSARTGNLTALTAATTHDVRNNNGCGKQ